MKIAIITLLQVAYAMLVQEISASKDAEEVSRLKTAQAALYGVITVLTAVNDLEVDAATGRVAQRLAERAEEKKNKKVAN